MTDTRETDMKGIPVKGPYPKGTSIYVLYSIMTSIFSLITGCLAYKFIVSPNAENTLPKLQFLNAYDLGYLYASFIILKIGQLVMGMNAGTARKHCRVHPPDQHIYKVHGEDKFGYVFLEQDGVNGKFNRAQRAIANYQETFPQLALYVVASGMIYPKQVMMMVILYAQMLDISRNHQQRKDKYIRQQNTDRHIHHILHHQRVRQYPHQEIRQ